MSGCRRLGGAGRAGSCALRLIRAGLGLEGDAVSDDRFVRQARDAVTDVAMGKFQAMMQVELVNDGPVTILLDSQKVF